MSYQIKQGVRVVETHARLQDAERAFWVLTAHELKCGRVANLEFDTRSEDSVCAPEVCRPPLPDWAVDVLRQHGFFGGAA